MPKTRLLHRNNESFSVSSEMWAETLALALRFDWNPADPTTSYLASGFNVTGEAASELSDALDVAFQSALSTPISFYPVRVEMGELYELNEFIRDGAFVVQD